jgi:hypothetical protein
MVVIHVDDAGLGRGALRHLVGVVAAGQAGADVEELADARLGGQVVDRAAEEGTVGDYLTAPGTRVTVTTGR